MNNPMVIDKYNIYDIFYVNDRVHIITPTSNDESHKMKITYDDQMFIRDRCSSTYYCLKCEYKEYIDLCIDDEHINNVKVNKYPEFNDDIVLTTMVKNEDNYIIQWIEYHLSIGFTKFLIYDNSSSIKTIHESDPDTSDLQNVLKEYIEKGEVILIEWKYPFTWGGFNRNSGQLTQQNHALRLLTRSRYVGFFDIDEYINITNYESHDGIISILDDILLKSNRAGVRMWCKFMQNPSAKETKGYEFLKITDYFYSIHGRNPNEHCFNSNNSPKIIVIPSRTYQVSVHTYKEKGQYNFFEIRDHASVYFNHYYFLNKTNRKGWRNGKKCIFNDDSLVIFHEKLTK